MKESRLLIIVATLVSAFAALVVYQILTMPSAH